MKYLGNVGWSKIEPGILADFFFEVQAFALRGIDDRRRAAHKAGHNA
jgi:hypothetical protein